MAKIRLKKKKTRFATVSRELLTNPNISLRAKGLGSWFELHQDGFELNFEFIKQNMLEGRDALRKALNELRSEDFLLTLQVRNESGKFETIWVFDSEGSVSEYALPTTEKPEAVQPTTGKPEPEKPTQIIKKNKRKDKKEKSLSKRADFLKSQLDFINWARAHYKDLSINTVDENTKEKIVICVDADGLLYNRLTGKHFRGTRALKMWANLYRHALNNPEPFLQITKEETTNETS